MELLIKGKNLEVEEAAQEYIRSKLNKLERHLPDIGEVKVELTQEMTRAAENRYVVQVTISSHGALLRGEERAANINAAVDNVVDVLNRQIERLKGRLYRSQRRPASPRKGLVVEPEETIKIVKIKRFPVKSMSPEEAVEQMELLGHNFFIFVNDENDRFGVIYRRSDGNYGLIDPVLA
jgi:putative sigma-54 modulation protein